MFVAFERTLFCHCLTSARVIHTTRPSIQLPREAAYTVVRWFLAALDCLIITVDIADSIWARARCPIFSTYMTGSCGWVLPFCCPIFICFCSKRLDICSIHCTGTQSCRSHRFLLRFVHILLKYIEFGVYPELYKKFRMCAHILLVNGCNTYATQNFSYVTCVPSGRMWFVSKNLDFERVCAVFVY